jgi:hypothetical protein
MFALLHDVELQVLKMARADAARLAALGDVSAGYECLAVGLMRAQEMLDDGEPWAADLVRRYTRELGEFRQAFSVLVA